MLDAVKARRMEEGSVLQPYVFMTDSDSDLPYQIAEERNIPVVRMPYTLNGVEYFDDNGRSGREKELFGQMRKGAVPVTSLLPTAAYLEYFEPILKEKDLLFVAFSSQMSATINNIFEAREELLAKYPQRRFTVVDTLSICIPQTLLVIAAHDLYLKGASMDEVERWVLDNRLRAHAWFTVDDLVYLKRGGRISPTSAMFGSMLDIKPILALSRAGKLEAAAKVQGRKRALRAIVDRVAENIENPHEQDVIVIHGDVEQEALLLKDMLTQRIPDIRGIKVRMIGAVIGAHCGPGTLACCFMGRERPV